MPSNNVPVNGWPQLKLLDKVQPILSKLDKIERWQKSVKLVTRSGNVVTVPNALALDAQSLKVTFAPIQSGSGDPSPTNVRPISGHTGASAIIAHKNLLSANDPNYGNYTVGSTGSQTVGTNRICSGFIPCKGKTYVTASGIVAGSYVFNFVGIAGFDKDFNFVSRESANSVSTLTYTIPQNVEYIKFFEQIAALDHTATPQDWVTYKRQLEFSDTASTWEELGQTHTTPFGDTYYSGYVDIVNGELVGTHTKTTITEFSAKSGSTSNNVFYKPISDMKRISGDLTPSLWSDKYVAMPYNTITANDITTGMGVNEYGNICVGFGLSSEIDTLEKANAWATANPIEVCYELATPIRISLTPQLVTLLKGYNTIYADIGPIEIVLYTGDSWS